MLVRYSCLGGRRSGPVDALFVCITQDPTLPLHFKTVSDPRYPGEETSAKRESQAAEARLSGNAEGNGLVHFHIKIVIMKRRSFMQMCVSAASVFAIPSVSLAERLENNRDKKPFKVDAGKDRFAKPINLFGGDTFYTKVSTKDTNGDLYIFESSRVNHGGPALHFHYSQDECWYVLEGEFLIKVGDKLYNAKAGDTVFGPRGVPHAFTKTNDGNARLLMTFQPAGKMEEFFIAVSEGQLAKMPLAEQDEFKKQHGFERVGPPLDYHKKA